MPGRIVLHKKILDREWYSDINVRIVFLHCLLKANREDKKWKGQIIERGSFISSIGNLSDEVGITRKQTLLALKKLEKSSDIITKRNNKRTAFYIVNYGRYQDKESEKEHQKNIKGTSKEHQRDTTKQYNNITSKQNIESLEIFIEKWNNAKMGGLPKLPKVIKVNDTLKKARTTKIKQYTAEEIKEGANNYIMHIVNGKKKNPDNDYFNHRFTLLEFLNRKGGLDKFINLSSN